MIQKCIGFIPDHLGSSSVLTNSNGEISNWYGYMPFGEPLMELTTGQYNNPYKYNGKETDSQTGLHYYGARYYDSQRSFWVECRSTSGTNNGALYLLWEQPY